MEHNNINIQYPLKIKLFPLLDNIVTTILVCYHFFENDFSSRFMGELIRLKMYNVYTVHSLTSISP